MRISPAGVVCCLLVAAVALAGCREAEQGRVMRYQKGTYLGPKEAPLSDAVHSVLRQRAEQQRVSATPPGGAAEPSQPAAIPAVRIQGLRQGTDRASAPASASALSPETLDSLRARMRQQRAN